MRIDKMSAQVDDCINKRKGMLMRCVTLFVSDRLSEPRHYLSLTSAAYRVLSLRQKQSRSGQVQTSSAGDPLPCLSAVANAQQMVNVSDLKPVGMPLEIQAFTKLPVIATAKGSGPGKPLGSSAVLFCDTKPAQSRQPDATVRKQAIESNGKVLVGVA